MPFVGDGSTVNYANTTSGYAQGVRALYGVGGLGVRVRGPGVVPPPTPVSHIITETGTLTIDTENSEQFITESS